MSYKQFQTIFHDILYRTPLPNGDRWSISILQNSGIRNNQGWIEALYQNTATYQCNHGHSWQSAWSMISFKFHLDVNNGTGIVRIKRFGQRCKKCTDDDSYHIGYCRIDQARHIVECLLLYILQKCYEGRSESGIDDPYCIIPISTVPRGRFGGFPHNQPGCEACANDRCQKIFRKLTKQS